MPTPRRSEWQGAASQRSAPWRPTPAQLAAAEGGRVPDVIRDDLAILFCGINPGLYSAAVRRHFARPGNRFWKALHGASLTPRLLSPFEAAELLALGLGVTNLVDRATATADQLSPDEIRAGARRLAAKVRRRRPRVVAFLGLGAYRTAFARPRARLGRQDETIGESIVWLLPNPSGLNAGYSLAALTGALADLARALDGMASCRDRGSRRGAPR